MKVRSQLKFSWVDRKGNLDVPLLGIKTPVVHAEASSKEATKICALSGI
jgi:uncharacterized membrane protein